MHDAVSSNGSVIRMKTHYYLDWYEDKGFSEKLVKALQTDIHEYNSLVFISGDKLEDQIEVPTVSDVHEKKWFDQVGLNFERYHYVHHKTAKNTAQQLIQEASVIFICGGYPTHQLQLIAELELVELIKDSHAVIMGTSAGGMNMSAAYVEEGLVCSGLGLSPFSFEGHFDYENIAMVKERFDLSNTMNVYIAADQEGAVVVKDGETKIIGKVYLVSHSQLHRLAE